MAAKRNHWQVYNSGTQQCYLFKTTAVTVPASCGFRRQICADTNNAFTSLNQQHNMLTECLGSGGGGGGGHDPDPNDWHHRANENEYGGKTDTIFWAVAMKTLYKYAHHF